MHTMSLSGGAAPVDCLDGPCAHVLFSKTVPGLSHHASLNSV